MGSTSDLQTLGLKSACGAPGFRARDLVLQPGHKLALAVSVECPLLPIELLMGSDAHCSFGGICILNVPLAESVNIR